MEEMKEAFGVDMEGFANLTMVGNGDREKGIAIMVGGMDVERTLGWAGLISPRPRIQGSRSGGNPARTSTP